jgi:uncharacterized protein YegL
VRRQTSARRFRDRFAALALAALLVAGLFTAALASAAPAGAPAAPGKPPILILDGGLGDRRVYAAYWLGAEQDVATNGSLRLETNAAPRWWSGAGAPDTYVLSASEPSGSPAAAPIGPRDIAWALDVLASRHPAGRSVIVAQGAMGLSARQYLEDLGDPKESARADVVGLVELGTPNRGLTLLGKYPSLDIWPPYAAAAGFSADDLRPGSTLLTSLDSGHLPGVLKTFVVSGDAVDLAGYKTDGVAVTDDGTLAEGVAAGPVDYKTVKASLTEAWPLVNTWHPETRSGGAPIAEQVSDDAVTNLGLMHGYAASPETMQAVKTYYSAWFSGKIPTTHVSSRLVLDLSGSMDQQFGSGSKLDAAKSAADDFADSVVARQGLGSAVPEDLGLITFNDNARVAVAGTSDIASVKSAIPTLRAGGHTDLGAGLDTAVRSFATSPKPADKVVVLLSDGRQTVGLNNSGILRGPVADAKKLGVRIDTIAMGSDTHADIGFLKQIATASGGSFHQSRDQFELRRDFLRARYSSLGTMTVDADVSLPLSKPVDLGIAPADTRLLEIGVLPDGKAATWQVYRDGKPVAASAVKSTTSGDGFVTLSIESPAAGVYTLSPSDPRARGRVHVFAVMQADAFVVHGVGSTMHDDSLLLLIGAGVVLALSLVLTVGLGVMGRRRAASGPIAGEPVEATSPLQPEPRNLGQDGE